jgi:hypothetical protein
MSNAHNNLSGRLLVYHTVSAVRGPTGMRGRPQKNPRVVLDLSGAPSLVREYGEKAVRLEAFRKLRSYLGVDAGCVFADHPKEDGVWILKSEALGPVDIQVFLNEVVFVDIP